MRRLAPRLLACALMGAGAAQAEPFTVARFLHREELGQVTIAPSERWLVAPVTAPYDTAPRWDLQNWASKTITQLRVFDLVSGGPPRIYPAKVGGLDDWGYAPGPYSPSGAKMAVTRARGAVQEVGVLTLATGETVWTGLYPGPDQIGRAVQWRSEDQLIVVAVDPDAMLMHGMWQAQAQARWPRAWEANNAGQVSVTATGSGRYLGTNPTSAPTRLVRVEAATGAGEVLATGDFLDLEVAPSGRYAALWANGEPLALDPATPLSTTDAFRRHRLTLVDLSSGEAWAPCPDCDLAPYLMGWSPGGDQLLVFARRDGATWDQAQYWRIEPAQRTVAPLSLGTAQAAPGRNVIGDLSPRADWLGTVPLILARDATRASTPAPDWFAVAAKGPINLTAALPPGPRVLEAVSDKAIVVSVKDQVFQVDADGHARSLGSGQRLQPTTLSGQRLLHTNRPALAQLALTGTAGGLSAPVAYASGRLTAIGQALAPGERVAAVAIKAKTAITVRRDIHGIETLAFATAGARPRVLATVNAALAEVDFAAAKAISHKGARGEALTSWLYLPPASAPQGARLPLVVIPYPGAVYGAPPPRQEPPTRESDTNAQILAGHGYAVLVTSLPIDTTREPAEGLATDILNIVDAAAAAEPRLDVERLAIWGHSYGGWTALMAATQTRRFKAVVASAFVADWFGAYSRSNFLTAIAPEAGLIQSARAGYVERGQGRLGAPPWVAPDRYVRNSPLTHAEKVTAPVLMAMGDMDSDPGQLDRMFSALFRQNKDAQALLYHGEGHVLLTPANITDLYQRIFAFLDAHLGIPAR